MFTPPRKAATVALLRDNPDDMEILIMRRHREDRFLPDYHVFPGGALDREDFGYEFTGSERVCKLKEFKNDLTKYYAFIICAMRETFEECGILLAADKEGNYPEIKNGDSAEKYSLYRKDVFNKKISFMEMLKREKLSPAVENLFYIDRWITPPFFPIRYDARFFAAIAPDNQLISHDGDELVDFQWIKPGEALDEYRQNRIKLVTPTIKTLEFLNRFRHSGEVIEAIIIQCRKSS